MTASYVVSIATTTDAVLIRSLGPDEKSGCAVFEPTTCLERGKFEIAYYDPQPVIGAEGGANYCGALYACSIEHAIRLLHDRAGAWFPGVAVAS